MNLSKRWNNENKIKVRKKLKSKLNKDDDIEYEDDEIEGFVFSIGNEYRVLIKKVRVSEHDNPVSQAVSDIENLNNAIESHIDELAEEF